jgi:hypothetical protein
MHDPLTWLANNVAWLSLVVSMLSFVVSAFAVGWNVYRDAIRKPRLAVSLSAGWSKDHSGEHPKIVHLLALSVVNRGPGKVKCEYVVFRTRPAWQALFGRRTWAAVPNDPDAYFDGLERLESLIEEADGFKCTFEYDGILDELPHPDWGGIQIGVRDSYGQFHWAPKRDLREVQKRWLSSPFESPSGQNGT